MAVDRDVDAIDSRQELRDLLRDLQGRVEALHNAREYLADEVEELRAENEELRERLASLEGRVETLENDRPGGKEAKVRDIVQHALNLRDDDQPVVVLTTRDIVGATGVSRRYAYDLCGEDGLPAEYHWILTREAATERQYGNAELDWDAQETAIAVDVEALHCDTAALNKFTNADSEEGGQE